MDEHDSRSTPERRSNVKLWRRINTLLLFLLCVVAPVLIRAGTGWEGAWVFVVTADVFWFLVLLGVAYVWQRCVYRLLRGKLHPFLAWTLLLVCPAVLGGGWMVYRSLPAVRAAETLARAELPPLPPSAHGIKHCWFWGLDQEDEYVRFAAEPKEVEAFLDTVTVGRTSREEIGPRVSGPTWYEQERAARSRSYVSRSLDDYGLVTLRVAASDMHVVLIHCGCMQITPSERDAIKSAVE